MPPIRPARQTGRYADRRSVRTPAQGLARPPAGAAIRTAVVAVPDPMEPGARLLATVNTRTDILEDERSHGRISEAAYQVGRMLQEAFERTARLGSSSSWNDGGRIDMAERHELAIGYAVQDARRLQALMRRVENAVGVVGARMLRAVIGDRTSFAAIAAARGRAGDRATRQAAAHFRMLLEETAEHFAARGPAGR
ncbi:hypothetical protein RHODGE_RHODGE_03993 [Rhodoplanes serenus]|uniref:Uncharacterized protein n=1 Tax=Rhodoplanes serenus TaxID=200615 RepID=A0A3S4DHW6_9BRAD|nr:hypothetical protein [Rhodoplanes serenus]VCU10789.1 hypothetical protein RHODGE_RHODGE_03993 [Rhodoplanes serenus]